MQKFSLDWVKSSVLDEYRRRGLLTASQPSSHGLAQGIAYVLANPGKCLRAGWLFAAGLTLEASVCQLQGLAAALELVHAFSLVQDDLPCMDDDMMRRGQLSCHRVFGDAGALLVSDALLNEAYAMLAADQALTSEQRCAALVLVSQAVGRFGLLRGQFEDLYGVGDLSEEALLASYRLKTGLLFELAIDLAALAAGKQESDEHKVMQRCIKAYGMAFQVADDCTDTELALNKAHEQAHHYVVLFGRERAQNFVASQHRLIVSEGEKWFQGTQFICFYHQYGKQALARARVDLGVA
jgi:geranylgeranyl diphosphate synthase, type II